MLRRIPLISLASLAGLAAVVACGSLSDPDPRSTKALASTNDSGVPPVTELVGTVAVPDGTHIAVVWRAADDTMHVQGDAVITGGKFTLSLPPPSSDWFVLGDSNNGQLAFYPSVAAHGGIYFDPLPPAANYPNAGAEPLSVAQAQLVVYEDTNGNGVFDLDPIAATTTDSTITSSSHLLDFYMGGDAFDYEKLSAAGGPAVQPGYNVLLISVPSYNMKWIDRGEIDIPVTSPTKFFQYICGAIDFNYLASKDAGNDPYFTVYPDICDPRVTCSPDGHSFSYPYWMGALGCVPGPPTGLCNLGQDESEQPICNWAPGADSAQIYVNAHLGKPDGGGVTLPPGAILPRNWPCWVDGGVYADAGPSTVEESPPHCAGTH